MRLASSAVNVVMVRGDEGVIQDMVDRRMRSANVRIIDPRDPLGASLAIHAALQRGEAVCMLGDRVFGEQPWCEVLFLGKKARLPLGPFHAAAITGAPIVVCFLMKTGDRSYYLDISEPWHIHAPGRGPERRLALQAAAQRWALCLERQVRKYPLQWHNFYDF
jgi:predicted LPLAT superfamily acyltransferase